MLDAPAASLGSENCRVKSAVEMTPRGKRGKLKNPQASFPLFPPGLEIRQKHKGAGFPHFHRAGDGLSHSERTKHEAETKFQLTDHGHFKHYNCASVASLRP